MSIVYLNGFFLEESHAFIPIHDRGFLFGDGVFTTIRIHDGHIEYIKEHLERIKHDSKVLNIEFPNIDLQIFEEILQKNNALKGTWRMKIVITGKGDFTNSIRPYGVFLISLKPYNPPDNHPIRLSIYPYPITSKYSHIKSLAYVERFNIRQFAKNEGFEDAITLSPEGYLLETSFSNIFWIEKGQLFTPEFSLPLLKGIQLSQILKETHLKVNQGKFRWEEISFDASVYICNSLTGIRSIKSIMNHEYSYLPFKKNI